VSHLQPIQLDGQLSAKLNPGALVRTDRHLRRSLRHA
jgi:hypothetical protein